MTSGNLRNRLLSRFHPYGRRGGELSIGLTAKYLSDQAFDYLLYPYVILMLGIIKGGAVMATLAAATNLLTLKFYDWSKRDWLGIETLKDLKEYAGEKRLGRFASWFLRRSEPAVFLFLSLRYDAFTTTAYLRHGKFSGMSKRDWHIFMGSLLFSNAYWTLACFMGITLFEWAWKVVTSV